MPKTKPASPPPKPLRILHTADWHLGKRLYNETRYDEFDEFLTWVLDTLNQQAIDVLIVAGDIFDTMTPSNKAQELYYQFLARLNTTTCRHAIIVAGNHDSPSFLDAPKGLLKSMNIHVVGTPHPLTHQSDDNLYNNDTPELIVLYDEHPTSTKDKTPIAIICAVPYLRDKDARDTRHTTAFDECLDDKQKSTLMGIYAHYDTLAVRAKALQDKLHKAHGYLVPIIATGHLFAIGASASSDDDGMRPIHALQAGSLGAVSSERFAPAFDYVALGHIHAMQQVGKHACYYSGSPLAMGFGEAGKDKFALLASFEDNTPTIQALSVPIFRPLLAVKGDLSDLISTLNTTTPHTPDMPSIQPKDTWLEFSYTGKVVGDLSNQLEKLLADYPHIRLLSLKNLSVTRQSLTSKTLPHHLTELSPSEVFDTLLSPLGFAPDDEHTLRHAYQSLLSELAEQDRLAT